MDRYIGLDAHSTSCTIAVVGPSGRRLGSQVVETNGQALVEAMRGIPRPRHLCFEEGTQSAWLHELLSREVDELIVASITESRGPKSDARDAFGLAEALRLGAIATPVFKAPTRFALLRELARTYSMITRDVVRTQNRLKSVYRSRGIGTAGTSEPGTVSDVAAVLELLGPRRSDASSNDWVRAGNRWLRSDVAKTRGLNPRKNSTLKMIFKGAATTVITHRGNEPLHKDYERLLEQGTKPNLAKLTLARKIAATALAMWKQQEVYAPAEHRKQ
jgi:hypothetical protein